MANYFCEYCGVHAPSIQSLTSNSCSKHPNGSMKGKHKLYEGNEKSKYFCKYCGTYSSSIMSLTGNKCSKHPDGTMKGNHSPAL